MKALTEDESDSEAFELRFSNFQSNRVGRKRGFLKTLKTRSAGGASRAGIEATTTLPGVHGVHGVHVHGVQWHVHASMCACGLHGVQEKNLSVPATALSAASTSRNASAM